MIEGIPARLAVLTSGWDTAVQIVARRLAWQGTRVLLCVADHAEAGACQHAEAGLPLCLVTVPTENAPDAIAQALQPYGPIDVLVHGPVRRTDGAGSVCGSIATSLEVRRAIDEWSANVELVVRHAASDRRSRIVTIVSSIGRYRSGYFILEHRHRSHALDAACQSALLGLMRQRAAELGPDIALNAVATGWIGRPELSPTGEPLTDTERQFLLEEIALRRPGAPEEVAPVIEFLASQASSYLSGEVIDVNGGWWMS
jgi:NAD(P)-dependent dehydrogenase (short-subunit alcohol dehydrogenase family)